MAAAIWLASSPIENQAFAAQEIVFQGVTLPLLAYEAR
jgi:hypothetical protein